MAIVGCYTLDLYCDTGGTYGEGCPHKYGGLNGVIQQYPAQFTGRTEGDCIKQAKGLGWKIRAGKAYCPKCAALAHL